MDDLKAKYLGQIAGAADEAALEAGIPESVLSVIRDRGLYGRPNA